jgi:Flp pilus assembly pilin Flp
MLMANIPRIMLSKAIIAQTVASDLPWGVMLRAIRTFLRRCEAQDLVEYTLLLAFIALVGLSIVLGASGSIQGIWGSSNTTLAAANTSAGGDSAAPPSSASPTNPTDPSGNGGGSGDGKGHGDHDR